MDYSTALALSAGIITIFVLIGLVLAIITIIAEWKLLKKAGQPGWASLIPVYNVYKIFQLSYAETKQFWIYLILSIAAGIFSAIGQNIAQSGGNPILFSLLSLAASIAVLVVFIRLNLCLAKAFGRGTGFAVGLILLNFIFMLILGFGADKYVGPLAQKAAPEAAPQA